MKDKIQIEQSHLIKLLVDKINFLTEEYKILHSAYKSHKGKITVDPLIIVQSYENFLKEYGDIDRILELYQLFINEDIKTEENTKTTRTKKKDDNIIE